MTLPPFLVPIAAGLFAQALKPLISRNWRKDQTTRLDPRPRYGGMPSAHTAFSTSLATLVGLVEGAQTVNFALAIAFLIFVLDDALRLRVFLSRFGIAIHRIAAILPVHSRENLPPIEERIGHSVPEVLAGAVIGILTTVLVWTFDQ
jgi:acid phosphatase family membrane protein YuiD